MTKLWPQELLKLLRNLLVVVVLWLKKRVGEKFPHLLQVLKHLTGAAQGYAYV